MIDWIKAALGVVTPIDALRAKIELRDAQLSEAASKNTALEKENQTLKEENAKLRQTVADHQDGIERQLQPRPNRGYDPYQNI